MFDIIIVSAEKDFNKLGYVYDSIMSNIVDPFGEVYLISNKKHNISCEVINYLDDEVLKIDRSDIPYRPNWIAQQYLKMFQAVTENDYYLVVDSDVIFNKLITIFEDDKPTFFFGRNQNYAPYFEYSQKMLGVGREYSRSFINEFMLFDKRIIREMVSKFDNNRFEFIRRSNDILSETCHLSEFELYGNYVYELHGDTYNYKNIKAHLGGKHSVWSDRAIEERIEAMSGTDYDVFTLHSWC